MSWLTGPGNHRPAQAEDGFLVACERGRRGADGFS